MIKLEEMLDIDNETISFEEFKDYLHRGNYSKAVDSLSLLGVVSPSYQAEYHLYLFLLNQLELLPLDYNWIKNCQLRSYPLKDPLDYEIRKSIDNARTIDALKKIRAKYKKGEIISKEDKILIDLLQKCVIKNNRELSQELLFEKEKNFEGLLIFLEHKQLYTHLTQQESQALELVRLLLSDEKIRMRQNTQAQTFFEAIAKKDYEQAKKLNQEYHQSKNNSENILNILLEEIIKKARFKTNYETLANFKMLSTFKMSQVQSYLKEKGKSNLYPIFEDLVSISMIEEDELFEKPNQFLSEIKASTYQYHLFPYLLSFSEEVKNSPLKAYFYLDILKQGENLGVPCPFIPKLEEQLKREKDASFEEKVSFFQKIK